MIDKKAIFEIAKLEEERQKIKDSPKIDSLNDITLREVLDYSKIPPMKIYSQKS